MSARSEFISGLIMLVVTAVFYIASLEIEEDPFGVGMQPYVFPKAICLLIGALTLVLLITSGFKLRREGFDVRGGEGEIRLLFVWVLPMALIAFGYLGLINLLQYFIPTVAALSATLALFGNRGIKWLLTIPLISGVFYYAIFFGIFRLLEPPGMLIDYDNYYLFGPMRKFLGI
ncbi:MAG: tripartite tricarboxylate transporter TctB family protein [Alphaproteobacteria bacterium]|nr:tripartite tricarboxylate transporter TctB family protein [Alphaproteobacteria bacterium]